MLEKCGACGKVIPEHEEAFVAGDRVLCGLCNASANASAVRTPSILTMQSVYAMNEPPTYRALQIAAYVIMVIGCLGSIIALCFSAFIVIAGGFGSSRIGGPDFVAAILGMIYGVTAGIFAVASGQLLLAIRDMAINSFHMRRSLVTLTRPN